MTLFFIIITCAISLMGFGNKELFDKLKFNAYMVYHRKEWYRLFSHGLLHADYMHLAFNMIALYSFGDNVEMYFKAVFGIKGLFYYSLMYISALCVSSLPSLLQHKNDHTYNAIGASGAVSAVLFAAILFDPFISIGFIFIPIPIPGWVFGPAYLLYSHYMGKKGIDNIGHDAHFYGAVYGFLFPVLLNYKVLIYFINRFFE